MLKGYVPGDWVKIHASGLTEKQAFEAEANYRHLFGSPKFDRTSGEKNHKAKLTDTQACDIYIACKNNANHGELANKYGVSRSAISMIASRKQWRAATACLI